MWFKAALLGGSGIIFSNLAVWTMAGLGITLAFHSSREWVDYRNRKLNVVARDENDNGIDRENDNGIDRLPDDILCNIVSRLRSIEASRTSILSRRWRKLWTMNRRLVLCCLLTLDVFKKHHDHIAFGDRQRFLEAVNQCLQLYSGCKLKLFLLHCCFLNDHTGHLVQWMQTLARLDVEELYLGHSCETCNGDPIDRVFTFSFKLIDGFSRLRYLDLMSCDVETNFVSQCNSLVGLNLSRIPLPSQKLSDILLSCPNLKSLCMEHCELPRSLRISGSNRKLEKLKLLVCYNVQKIEISDFNAVTIMIDIRSKVEILLSSVPKLERLHLRTHETDYRFGDVQRDLPQLKYLLIQTSYQMLRLSPTFRVFRNVRELYLMTRGYPYPEAGEEVDLWNFAQVLGACPLLEVFFLEIGGPVCKQETKGQWPVLRHEHLWLMELSGFSNTQNELEFANFILTSAQVLECLRLRLSSRKFDGQRFYFEDEKDLKQMDAQVAEAVCADLQGHALSMRAKVKLF